MTKTNKITCLFLDIGNVLLTDGWDHHARKRAALEFNLELTEQEKRHHLVFETFEEGKLTLDDYLKIVIFYKKRPFTPSVFRRFMFAQSLPHPEMIELIRHVKIQHGLKIAVVSNEACELNAYRIKKYKLNEFVDFFISSCFVHIRKPDAEIFQLALDTAQVRAEHVMYIDDQPLFIEIAKEFGIAGICHTDYQSTLTQLTACGLNLGEGTPNGNP